MNADGVQTEGKGNNENRIQNAKSPTQSVKTVSPKESITRGIGKNEIANELECGICNEIEEEGVAARLQKVQEMPSEEEVERHNLNHIPFRSWCPHCVAGKGIATQHRASTTEESEGGGVTMSMDY